MAKETGGQGRKGAPPVLAGRTAGISAERKQALDSFTNGRKLMGEGKFEKAAVIFSKMDATTPIDILERARIYLLTCERQQAAKKMTFATPHEEYDYAISLLNQGQYPDAQAHLEAVLARQKDADYAMYGLAVLNSMTRRTDQSLQFLEKAIALNPANRLHARSDNDFQDVMDDPRFTELLYPEAQ